MCWWEEPVPHSRGVRDRCALQMQTQLTLLARGAAFGVLCQGNTANIFLLCIWEDCKEIPGLGLLCEVTSKYRNLHEKKTRDLGIIPQVNRGQWEKLGVFIGLALVTHRTADKFWHSSLKVPVEKVLFFEPFFRREFAFSPEESNYVFLWASRV